jgi:hypothetical protein
LKQQDLTAGNTLLKFSSVCPRDFQRVEKVVPKSSKLNQAIDERVFAKIIRIAACSDGVSSQNPLCSRRKSDAHLGRLNERHVASAPQQLGAVGARGSAG